MSKNLYYIMIKELTHIKDLVLKYDEIIDPKDYNEIMSTLIVIKNKYLDNV